MVYVIKKEWCEKFIKAMFEKLPEGITKIETGYFWKMAEKSGLWIHGTYGTPMSEALSHLTTVEIVQDECGNYSYSVFKMKKN